MSVEVNILFVARDPDLDATIARLGELLRVPFSRIDDDGLVRYEYIGLGFVLVAFGDHGFESEVGGHRLSEYDVAIDCIASDPAVDYEAAESIRMGIGRFIFRKLVARGDKAILLYDLQRLLEASDS